jgi:hypothetical protein
MTANGNEANSQVAKSYFELEIRGDTINVYERMGDGATCLLAKALERLGLRLRVRVSSPCG